MTAPVVSRPDLSARRGLSKSALTSFAMCSQKAWQRKHYPRPFIPKPKMSFGSCLDAACEVLIKEARAGIDLDIERALAASVVVEERDGVEVDQAEIEVAVRAFVADVMPRFDFALCRTQAHVHVTLPDWGEVDGHPDIVLASNAVWDVKSSVNPKQTALTVELGMYTLMVEEETGKPVPEAGYLTWVRDGHGGGYWQGFGADAVHMRELKSGPRKGQLVPEGHGIPSTVPDDELRRWTRAMVSAYVRADRADDVLNRARTKRGLPPENYSFPGGPVNASICLDCEFNPLFGGACQMAPAHAEGEDAE